MRYFKEFLGWLFVLCAVVYFYGGEVVESGPVKVLAVRQMNLVQSGFVDLESGKLIAKGVFCAICLLLTWIGMKFLESAEEDRRS